MKSAGYTFKMLVEICNLDPNICGFQIHISLNYNSWQGNLTIWRQFFPQKQEPDKVLIH